MAAILLGMRAPDAGIIKAPRRPAVETAYTFIEILPPNARVLLAWDYEPTTQGEMQLLANPILLHLRRKRARIANLSLRPTGPAVAADAGALVEYFDSSILPQPPSAELGFIPGDAAALRALSMSPAGTANLSEGELQAADMDAQDDVEAFDLIIEFSAETAATQEWVEQIAARQETPLIVAASGAVAPVLRPYEQSGQIAALLSGYADALAYERLTGVDGPAAAQRNPQSAAHLLLIAIIVLTLLLSLFRPSPAPAP